MYLKLDTKFNPFTYDEIMKPLLYYNEAYKEAEADYSDLASQSGAFEDIVNRETSPEAYDMYHRFSSELNNAIGDFSKGMTSRNRGALLGLKRRYAQEITPIAKASEAMKEANDLRVKAGPDAVFEVSEYNSLDPFLHGGTPNNRYQSKEAITKKTALMIEAAMQDEILKDPIIKKTLEDQYWEITQHTGGSYQDLQAALKQAIISNPIVGNRFSEIRNKVAADVGYNNYDDIGKQKIVDAIDTGLFAGLDKPTRQFMGNQNFWSDKDKMSLDLERERLDIARGKGRGKGSGKGSSSDSGSDSYHANRMKGPIKVRVTNVGNSKGWIPGDYEVGTVKELEKNDDGTWSIPDGSVVKEFWELSAAEQALAKKFIQGDNTSGYNYYETYEDASGAWTGKDTLLIIEPKGTVTQDTPKIDSDAY